MRIASCGGETGWRCLLLAHLAAEWMSRGRQAIIVDATPGQELISHLDVSPSLLSRLPRLGEEGFRIKEYVGGQGGVRASAIDECSQPSSRSRKIECSPEDPFLRCFSAEIWYPSLHTGCGEKTARLISLGSCDEGDITSLRRHHQALSILLNHLADTPHEAVFIHLNAGQLPCITGVLGRVDLAVLVDEIPPLDPTERELVTAGNTARSIRQTLEQLRTPTVEFSTPIALDNEVRWQRAGGTTSSPEDLLLNQSITLRMPRENPTRVSTREALRSIINFAEALPRDNGRFARNNELMSQIDSAALEETAAAI